MTRYLLGELSDAEREQFEERYFSDPALFAELARVEDDLIDDYVRGRLTPGFQRQFEAVYLATAAKSERVRFARALLARVDERSATPAVEPAQIGGRPPLSWWTVGLASAAAVLLSVAAWYAIDSRRTSSGNVASESSRPPAVNASGEQPIQPVPLPIVAFALAVGPGERAAASSVPPTLRIPAGMQQVRFDLSLQERDDVRYAVIIRAIGGPEIFRQTALVPAPTNPAFSLTLPARDFANGDYMLTLQATTRSGDTEDLSQTLFRVEKF
jgi:hypothetical protein